MNITKIKITKEYEPYFSTIVALSILDDINDGKIDERNIPKDMKHIINKVAWFHKTILHIKFIAKTKNEQYYNMHFSTLDKTMSLSISEIKENNDAWILHYNISDFDDANFEIPTIDSDSDSDSELYSDFDFEFDKNLGIEISIYPDDEFFLYEDNDYYEHFYESYIDIGKVFEDTVIPNTSRNIKIKSTLLMLIGDGEYLNPYKDPSDKFIKDVVLLVWKKKSHTVNYKIIKNPIYNNIIEQYDNILQEKSIEKWAKKQALKYRVDDIIKNTHKNLYEYLSKYITTYKQIYIDDIIKKIKYWAQYEFKPKYCKNKKLNIFVEFNKKFDDIFIITKKQINNILSTKLRSFDIQCIGCNGCHHRGCIEHKCGQCCSLKGKCVNISNCNSFDKKKSKKKLKYKFMKNKVILYK